MRILEKVALKISIIIPRTVVMFNQSNIKQHYISKYYEKVPTTKEFIQVIICMKCHFQVDLVLKKEDYRKAEIL